MRNRNRLTVVAAGFAVAVTMMLTAGGAASADPPIGVTPQPADIVGAGGGPAASLYDQLAHDFDSQVPAGPALYSWDAVNPQTGQAGDSIVTKAGCPAITRPGTTAAGIAALRDTVPDPEAPGSPCLDYARSYRARVPSDPPLAPGGITFVDLASDAVTYATRAAASGGTSAPPNLSAAQLTAIYTCRDTNWSAVGGADAPIHAFLPRPGSEVRTFFLAALGSGGTAVKPGACVSDGNGTLAENQGVSALLNDPDAVIPYAVSAWIAQAYHSAACLASGCGGHPGCVPSATQNLYGCDVHGVLGLNEINNTKPVKPWPLPPPPCSSCQLNTGFAKRFQHFIYTVVPYDPATADHIPPALDTIFGSSGWVCTSTRGGSDLLAYGFRRDCGMPH